MRIPRTAASAVLATLVIATPGVSFADPLCGDVNQSDTVTSSDALLVLRDAVGQAVELQCPAFATPPDCGNGDAESEEVCDGEDLRAKTCATEAPLTPFGTLGCHDDCSGFDLDHCVGRFDASGDTIIDWQTGLEWEKKDAADGAANLTDVHDADNKYTWGSVLPPYAPDGSAFTDFIGRLNGSADAVCYASHCDWRLPSVSELHGIRVEGCAAPPCVVDPGFLPAIPDYHWSSSTYGGAFNGAVAVTFSDYVNDLADGKTGSHYVRAVRTRP